MRANARRVYRAFLAAVFLLAAGSAGWAQSDLLLMAKHNSMAGTVAAPFRGLGDILSANGYWGFRAYSVATAGNNAADIYCVTAATTKTIRTLSNGDFDVATLVTGCPSDTYHVAKLYDQTGNGNDLTQATDGSRPVLTLNCINTSLPCMAFNGSTTVISNASYSLSGPNSFFVVGETTGNLSSTGVYIGSAGSNTPSIYHASAGTNGSYCGSGNPGVASSDNAWHVNQLVCGGTSLAIVYADNVAGTTATGVGNISSTFYLGTNGSNYLTGNETEAAVFNSAWSSLQRGALCDNAFRYWGTSISC